MQSLHAGQHLSNYRVVASLGGGGMADVYLVEHVDLGVRRALKVLKRADESLAARLLQEGRVQANLAHPNLVSVLEVIRIDGHPALIMDYVSGPSLDELLRGATLSVEQVDLLGRDILDGLIAAHGVGVIHRDLKPANILIDPRGKRPVARVSDFGLAKAVEGSGPDLDATATGIAMGTPRFMAPEQFRDAKRVDARADVWSAGAVLYELTTGRPAFQADSPMVVMRRIEEGSFEPIRDVAPRLPERMVAAIEAALVSDADARCPSVEALRALWVAGSEAPPTSSWDLPALVREPQPLPSSVPSDPSLLSESTRVLSAWGRGTSADSPDIPPVATSPGPAPAGRRGRTVGYVLVGIGVLALAVGLTRPAWLGDTPESPDATSTPQHGAQGPARTTLIESSGAPIDSPALSRDGTTIAYTQFRMGRSDLWVRRTGGGSPIRLTDDDALEARPAFSPDGDWIAYSRRRNGAETSEIVVIPSLGGDARVVLQDAHSPAWSPDGKRMVAVRRERGAPMSVVVVDVDGSGVRELGSATDTYPKLSSPTWSPDGRQIGLVRSTGGVAGEIWTLPAGGGPMRPLLELPAGVFSRDPQFTPDGERMIFRSNRSGAENLWSVRLDGTDIQQLTSGAGPDRFPSIADDGSILFLNRTQKAVIEVYDVGADRIRTPYSHNHLLWAPAFSPDHRTLAFSQGEPDGSWDIWEVDLEDGASRRVTVDDAPLIYPRYAPDGDHLYAQSWSKGENRIWRIPVAGGPSEALTPEGAMHGYADPSPDGIHLVYIRTEDGASRMWIRSLDGSEDRRVVDVPAATPRWSPDGAWIAFSPGRIGYPGIFLIRPDGSDLRQLSATGGWPVWWPDSQRLGFLDVAPDRSQRILVMDIGGGEPEPLQAFTFNGDNYPFAVSSDGRFIASSNTRHFSTDLWLLQPGEASPEP